MITQPTTAMQYDEGYEDEWVDDADAEEESSADLLICPSCRNPVHEETQQCPNCGDWIIPAWPERRSKRFVWILAVALLIAALVVITVLL